MANPRVLGYTDFREAMVYELRWDPARLDDREKATLHRLINAAVGKVSFPLVPGSDAVHQWSWLDPIQQLIVRPLVAGTLLDVPTRSGDLIILRSKTAIFDSDLVNHDLTFNATGQRYTIVEFIRETSIRMIPSARSPKGQLTQLGERVNGTFVGGTVSVSQTSTITESISLPLTQAFYADMVGDLASFASGSDYRILRVDVTNKKIVVDGDASGETGALTIKRRSFNNATLGSNDLIISATGTFRQDMADDEDNVRYVTSGSTYICQTFVSSSQMKIRATIASDDRAADLAFDIEKPFLTNYSVAADTPETDITVDDDIFVAEHVGLRLAFVNILVDSFEIVQVLTSKTVRVSGNATGIKSTDNAVAVVRAAGRLSTSVARPYDGVTTLLTASSAVFTSGMKGLAIEFFVVGRKYAITEFVSTTSIRVAGDASQEGSPLDQFFVVGPTDLAADDAFTVVNTGQDYEFDDNFGGIDGPVTFSVDDSTTYGQLTIRATSVISRARSRRSATDSGVPIIAAVVPQLHDGRFVQRMVLQLVPTPDAKYTLNFRQIMVQPDISEDVPYPPGGALYGELYKAACLAEIESEIRGVVNGTFRGTFVRLLASMIQVDVIGTAPEFIGRGYEEGAPSLSVSPRTTWNRADPIYTAGVD